MTATDTRPTIDVTADGWLDTAIVLSCDRAHPDTRTVLVTKHGPGTWTLAVRCPVCFHFRRSVICNACAEGLLRHDCFTGRCGHNGYFRAWRVWLERIGEGR